MTRHRFVKKTILIAVGGYVALLGGCLPEDYFAASGRSIAVAVADTLLAAAVTPFFNLILPPVDDGSEDDME